MFSSRPASVHSDLYLKQNKTKKNPNLIKSLIFILSFKKINILSFSKLRIYTDLSQKAKKEKFCFKF
jgi:hypothetical protein